MRRYHYKCCSACPEIVMVPNEKGRVRHENPDGLTMLDMDTLPRVDKDTGEVACSMFEILMYLNPSLYWITDEP